MSSYAENYKKVRKNSDSSRAARSKISWKKSRIPPPPRPEGGGDPIFVTTSPPSALQLSRLVGHPSSVVVQI